MASDRIEESYEGLENTTEKNCNESMRNPSRNDLFKCSLPEFLSLSEGAILKKFNYLKQYEATLAAKPLAFLRHDNLEQRDRYANIRPWANNTIQLDALQFPENYINASPISLGRNRESFIATQGPGPGNTVLHFWQMVWQEKVEVIVMLTQCVEAGKEKCGVYFPLRIAESIPIKACSEPQWGKVECVTQQIEDWGEIRQLRITNKSKTHTSEDRLLYHLLFTRWPDHQVPHEKRDQVALINLIKLSRQKMSHIEGSPEVNSSPRIIHCSAGVGRTGTFIALDHLLQELEENKLDHVEDDIDPIFDTVRRLREQRMGSVNNLQQYSLIYQILREKWILRHNCSPRPSGAQNQKVDRIFSQHKRIINTIEGKIRGLNRK